MQDSLVSLVCGDQSTQGDITSVSDPDKANSEGSLGAEKPMDKGMKAKINKAFIAAGLLLTDLAIEQIIKRALDYSDVINLAQEKGTFMVTKEFIEEFSPAKKPEQEFSFVIRKGVQPVASKIEPDLIIDKSKDVTGNSTSEGTVENFVELFRDRYKRLKTVLGNRAVLRDVIDLENLKRYDGNEVKIIGMIRDRRESKKGNLILEVEDPTGTALVVVTGELKAKGAFIVNDEVVGVIGNARGNFIMAKELIEPDIPTTKPKPTCEDNVSMAFLSDIHVGSLLFMEKEFRRFLDWLNLQGNGNQREIAESVKYIMIAGDLVDGVGIYPGQESELAIPDIYKQYDYLGKMLQTIPEYIEVVISTGNHDAVRRCEPQPSLALDGLGEALDAPNIHLVGNPAKVKAHGYEVLMYHGTSMDALISVLPKLSYNNPETAQIEYLRKRHLSPVYGTKEQIAPEEKDYMVIDTVPDIFHCGHVHKNGYANYRGVKVINSGTWQSQTDFQQMQGHMPTPCKVPIMDLRNMSLKVVNFA